MAFKFILTKYEDINWNLNILYSTFFVYTRNLPDANIIDDGSI